MQKAGGVLIIWTSPARAARTGLAGEARRECIVICFSGHGHFDLAAYDKYLSGKLTDYEHPDDAVAKALAELPQID